MRIPFFHQINRDYCAPAVMQMILAAHGRRVSQHVLAREAKTPRDPKHGTTTKNIVSVLKKYGFSVRASNNKTLAQIKKEIRKGSLVVVCYTEPVADLGHYAIVKKIANGKIMFIDPDSRTGTSMLLIKEFIRRWKDPLFTRSTRWAAVIEPGRISKRRSKK